jgi:hypothetical protein
MGCVRYSFHLGYVYDLLLYLIVIFIQFNAKNPCRCLPIIFLVLSRGCWKGLIGIVFGTFLES